MLVPIPKEVNISKPTKIKKYLTQIILSQKDKIDRFLVPISALKFKLNCEGFDAPLQKICIYDNLPMPDLFLNHQAVIHFIRTGTLLNVSVFIKSAVIKVIKIN